MTLALISHPRYLDHDEPSHPECAARLRAIHAALNDDPDLSRLPHQTPEAASTADLLAVHHANLLDRLEQLTALGRWADPETYLLPDSLEIAKLSAGGAIAAVSEVLEGHADQSFALIRPPGHHATPATAMGFCLLNNAAVAARFAQRAYGLQRVAILDWDVHHGNGTQDIFVDDPSVLYCSTHGWPLWPGSGHWREMGGRNGEGTTLNLPLPAMTGDMGFHQAFTHVLEPAIKAFRPELLIISAGYDAHLQDPLGPLALSTPGYANLASIVYNLAAEVCDGRLVGVLEGGYNLEALGRSVVATLRTWLGLPHGALAHDASHLPEPNLSPLLATLRHQHPLVEAGS